MQTITVQSQEETEQLAAAVGRLLKKGDIVLLKGPLAAGKTFFVQALARALGSEDYLSSPTYTIANFYNIRKGQLLHLDVYRVEHIEEFRDLGLEEYFEEEITLIEWGEKVAGDFEDYLLIEIETVQDKATMRNFRLTPVGIAWQGRLSSLNIETV